MVNKTTYKTKDLYYAAFLKTAGFNFVGLSKDGTSKSRLFLFEDESGLVLKVQSDYINGVAKVSAKELIDNIRALKTFINME